LIVTKSESPRRAIPATNQFAAKDGCGVGAAAVGVASENGQCTRNPAYRDSSKALGAAFGAESAKLWKARIKKNPSPMPQRESRQFGRLARWQLW
jgi:hypothetical protein